MNPKLHRIVGIDLGTTYSAVAVYDEDQAQTRVIHDQESMEQTTPSVISIDPIDRRVIVGRQAKTNVLNDPFNTIIEIKREMGRTFTEQDLEKFGWRDGTYRVGDPVRVRFDGLPFLPQEISAFTLMKMKQIAEREIGEEIRDAVVTVPAYFKESQRAATEEAALMAGLYPRQLLAEPTAAAICYGVDRMEDTRKTYVIYDLGGGTFDVSIITVEGQQINVVATSGDPRLGGGDFDDCITRWVTEELRMKHGMNVQDDPRAQAVIKLRAEGLKIKLSANKEAELSLLELRPQKPPIVVLTRDTFQSLIEPLLNKSLTFVEQALNDAKGKAVERDQFDAILLVGGSSKIPRVKQKLLEYFRRDESFVRNDLDPDAVVARGAAIMAQRFAASPAPFDLSKYSRQPQTLQKNGENVPEPHLITEHTLGVGVQDNRFSPILMRGTNIPVTKREKGYTNPEGATGVLVPVFQGEDRYAPNNTMIGTLEISNLDPRPAGYHQFEVEFTIDRNGLLTMVVYHMNTGKPWTSTFAQKTGVGGAAALATRRSMLLEMFNRRPTPVAGPAYPPVPGGVGISGAGFDRPIPAPPAPGNAPGGYVAPPAARAEPAPPPPPHPAVAAPPVDAAVATAAAPAAVSLVLPQREVPAQFQSIVRRTQKLLLKGHSPAIVQVFNAFITALNAGVATDDLVEIGDELEDAYLHATRS
jgi:molecular chaperone DnaK (HSP70)